MRVRDDSMPLAHVAIAVEGILIIVVRRFFLKQVGELIQQRGGGGKL